MRFLVLGATGMAGHMVALFLSERGHDVSGTARREADFLSERGVEIFPLDVMDAKGISGLLERGSSDVVINCIGLLNKACDQYPDKAVYLNSYLPHYLVKATEGLPTRVFHLSTDCVFAGNTGPYKESSTPDGKTFYDRTKALGEFSDEKNLVLRQSIVGPDTKHNGIGLLNWFMAQQGAIKGYTHAIWTGLTTLELAKAIEACAMDGATGLVNMVPDGGGISKCDLLSIFNDELREGAVEIKPDDALRLDKSLVRTNFDSHFRPLPYRDQICELATWISNHREIYPHYRIVAKR